MSVIKNKFLNSMNIIFSFNDEKWTYSAKLFRVGILFWIILNTVLLLPYHHNIWRLDAYINRNDFQPDSLYSILFQHLLIPEINAYYLAYVVAIILFSIFAILVPKRSTLIPVVFLQLNLDCLAGPTSDGGNNLLGLLLLFLLFTNSSGKKEVFKNKLLQNLSGSTSNAFFIMIRLQIILVYISAGLLKLQGDLWQSGMALYYIIHSETYSTPMSYFILNTFPYVAVLGTYAAILFQISFPFLIWTRKTRYVILTIGVLFHLGIIFGMGLLTFGLAMITSYLAWVPNDKSKNFLNQVQPLFDRTTIIQNKINNQRINKLPIGVSHEKA